MPRRSQHNREYIELGRRVRSMRRSLDWTQVELAEHAGLSPSYLAEVERGGRNPSLETILNLAAALNASAGYLVDGVRFEPPDGMGKLAELWTALSKQKQQAVAQMVSLLVPEKSEKSAPRRRSPSSGKSREKISK